jgi:ribonuclease HII
MVSLEIEDEIREKMAVSIIAGLDEAGRGAIAGPVVAAAVIIPLDQPDRVMKFAGVNDSKQLTPRLRENLYDTIIQEAVAYGIGISSASDIDQFGIIPANARAMATAVSNLSLQPEFLIIDGRMRIRSSNLAQMSVIRGDGKSLSIAAASILAKVTRDRIMVELDREDPGYHFASHKGYCTQRHVDALAEIGPCPEHRLTFAPMRKTLV